MQIEGQAAIVTGASSGLGEATARALASSGARVAVLDVREQKGETVAQAIGGIFCRTDVADERSVEAAFACARKAHGGARIIVNCAGIAGGWKTASETGPHALESFLRVLQVNLVGTFNCARFGAFGMIDLEPLAGGERGVIVNTASGAAFEGQMGQAAYSASKGGVVSLTLPMARDLAPYGIRVMTIAPGLFATDMVIALPEKVRESIVERMLLYPKRPGDPAEFASAVLEIVRNPMFNGRTLRLDAGAQLHPK